MHAVWATAATAGTDVIANYYALPMASYIVFHKCCQPAHRAALIVGASLETALRVCAKANLIA
jgi:hypothetical protein